MISHDSLRIEWYWERSVEVLYVRLQSLAAVHPFHTTTFFDNPPRFPVLNVVRQGITEGKTFLTFFRSYPRREALQHQWREWWQREQKKHEQRFGCVDNRTTGGSSPAACAVWNAGDTSGRLWRYRRRSKAAKLACIIWLITETSYSQSVLCTIAISVRLPKDYKQPWVIDKNLPLDPNEPFHSQEWSILNFACSLTRNIASHRTKNLAFHSLLIPDLYRLITVLCNLGRESFKSEQNCATFHAIDYIAIVGYIWAAKSLSYKSGLRSYCDS